MRTITSRVFAIAAFLMIPASAFAQMTWTDKAYVSVNVGAQAGDHTLTTNRAFSLYEEDGSIAATQKVGGGAFVDFGAAYKFRRNLLLGLSYSHSGSSADATITAQVPDPVVTDRPRTVSASLSNAKHSENAVHISAVYMVPVTDKIDVGISVGPSIFIASQDVPASVTVTEPGPVVGNVVASRVKKTTAGFNAGIDVTYLFTKKIGGGLLARYTWASADIPDAAKSLTLGGFQIGVGLRYRF